MSGVPSSRERRSDPVRLPRRATDRVEDLAAWIGMIGLLASIGLAVVAGLQVATAARDDDRATAGGRVAVSAVLLDPPPPMVYEQGSMVPAVRQVRYTDPRGQVQDRAATVTGLGVAGDTVTVWIDRAGDPVARPRTDADEAVLGVATGTLVGIVGGLVLLGARVLLRRQIDRRNAARWAREWAWYEPRWRRL